MSVSVTYIIFNILFNVSNPIFILNTIFKSVYVSWPVSFFDCLILFFISTVIRIRVFNRKPKVFKHLKDSDSKLKLVIM